MRIPFISLIAASSIALGGCAYGGLNFGYGDPYSSYGYGSQYGYGYNGGYGGYGYNSGYGSPYGYGSGYGYGSPYYGWNGGYYYPGTGYYVYDSYQRPRRWTNSQRRYWSDRQQQAAKQGVKAVTSPNWTGFKRERLRGATSANRARADERIAVARSKVEARRAERASSRSESESERKAERRRRPN